MASMQVECSYYRVFGKFYPIHLFAQVFIVSHRDKREFCSPRRYCTNVQFNVWFIYHNIRQRSENFLNLRIGQYFPNTLQSVATSFNAGIQSLKVQLLELKLPFDPVCLSVGWLVDWTVSWYVCNNFLKGRKVLLSCSYQRTCYTIQLITADRFKNYISGANHSLGLKMAYHTGC